VHLGTTKGETLSTKKKREKKVNPGGAVKKKDIQWPRRKKKSPET